MDIGKSISLPPASTASAVPAGIPASYLFWSVFCPQSHSYVVLEPEVKEYMQWRVRRNKKRLARLEGSVIMIQRAYRAYIARTLAWRAKNHRSAMLCCASVAKFPVREWNCRCTRFAQICPSHPDVVASDDGGRYSPSKETGGLGSPSRAETLEGIFCSRLCVSSECGSAFPPP